MGKLRIAAAAGAALLLVAGGWVLSRGRERARADAARAAELVEEARRILETAEREGLLPLAARSFAAARVETQRAEELLARGQGTAALAPAEAGRDKARAAREEASGRTPVARSATLRALHNKVLYRAASGIDWSDATAGQSLYDRDRIATREKAVALIRFDEGNEMRVEENSVMVVERFSQQRSEPVVALALSVPEGQVRTAVAREGGRDVRLEINLPKAGVVIDTARTAAGRAEIAAGVGADQSNRVAVYTGEAKLVGARGEELVLKQNQYATVAPDGALSAVKELPTAAIILLPGRNAIVYTSQQRPEVTFKWQASGACAGYRIEVARDGDFLDKLVDERVQRTSFTYGNLKPGRYVWRMACLGPDGSLGPWTEVSSFEVAVDNEAPRLAILHPQANAVLTEPSVEARCRTEAGATVFINGEEATARDGEHVRMVALAPGLNTLVFEAVDVAGNVIYNSRIVTRR